MFPCLCFYLSGAGSSPLALLVTPAGIIIKNEDTLVVETYFFLVSGEFFHMIMPLKMGCLCSGEVEMLSFSNKALTMSRKKDKRQPSLTLICKKL